MQFVFPSASWRHPLQWGDISSWICCTCRSAGLQFHIIRLFQSETAAPCGNPTGLQCLWLMLDSRHQQHVSTLGCSSPLLWGNSHPSQSSTSASTLTPLPRHSLVLFGDQFNQQCSHVSLKQQEFLFLFLYSIPLFHFTFPSGQVKSPCFLFLGTNRNLTSIEGRSREPEIKTQLDRSERLLVDSYSLCPSCPSCPSCPLPGCSSNSSWVTKYNFLILLFLSALRLHRNTSWNADTGKKSWQRRNGSRKYQHVFKNVWKTNNR